MSTITQVQCDIENCSDTASFTGVQTTAKFTTEQNEGRATTPYLETVKMDLCAKHKQELLNLTPITATGAMGHNKFNFSHTSATRS